MNIHRRLHSHPQTEKELGVPEGHVIVDAEDHLFAQQVLNMFPNLKDVSQIRGILNDAGELGGYYIHHGGFRQGLARRLVDNMRKAGVRV